MQYRAVSFSRAVTVALGVCLAYSKQHFGNWRGFWAWGTKLLLSSAFYTAFPWLGQSVAGLSPREHVLLPRPFSVRFWGGQTGLGFGFSTSTSVFPCQYHSTNAPYPFIHLPPTLYNISLPVLQFHLLLPFHQCSIPIHSHTTHTTQCFPPSNSDFPCQSHSTNAPFPFIHLTPTLYNVSLPVLQFSPVSTIPPILHTHSFT